MPRRAAKAIELAVAKAANRAEWLTDSDQAAVRLAKRLAETLDDMYSATSDRLIGAAAGELASKTTYTAQTLLRVLEQLGLTAQSRDALGFGSRAAGDDDLAAIRDAMANVVPLVADDTAGS